MIVKLITSPKFKARDLTDKIIGKRWAGFQMGVWVTGLKTYNYMKHYINKYRKRRPESDTLANRITFEKWSEPAQVGFRIGKISELPKYWYVLNYGKMFTGGAFRPGGGKWRPVSFDGTPARKGITNQRADAWIPIVGDAKIPRVIRPLRYIDASILKFNIEYRKMLTKLKTGYAV